MPDRAPAPPGSRRTCGCRTGDLKTTPIIQYWHEPDPPPGVVASFESFANRNPDNPHFVFDRASAEEFISSSFGTRELAAFQACVVPSMQSDYLRYCAVLAFGGVYADADMRCVDGLEQLIAGSREGVLFGRSGPLAPPKWIADPYPYRGAARFRTVVSGFLAFALPRHPLVELVVEIATANIESRVGEGPLGTWVATGPGILTFLYLLWQIGSTDSFLASARGNDLWPAASRFCELVGDPARVADAFDGVSVRPAVDAGAFIAFDRDAYAGHAEVHWSDFKASLYRGQDS
jgi:Glycosyltransferase sugar-binding region containing DXD motif